MTLDEAFARISIEHTMSKYVRYVDSGRAEELSTLFTDPMHYDLGVGDIARTADELRAAVESLKERLGEVPGRLRHHVSSIGVDFTSSTHCRSGSAFIAMTATGPDHWGVYRDELRLVDGVWLFAKRVVVVEGAGGASPVGDLVVNRHR